MNVLRLLPVLLFALSGLCPAPASAQKGGAPSPPIRPGTGGSTMPPPPGGHMIPGGGPAAPESALLGTWRGKCKKDGVEGELVLTIRRGEGRHAFETGDGFEDEGQLEYRLGGGGSVEFTFRAGQEDEFRVRGRLLGRGRMELLLGGGRVMFAR